MNEDLIVKIVSYSDVKKEFRKPSLTEFKDKDLFYGTGWSIEIFDVAEYYRNKNKGWRA